MRWNRSSRRWGEGTGDEPGEDDAVSNVHGWFRDRLAAHAAGLLDDAETARFLAHSRECAECAARLADTGEGDDDVDPDSLAHLPAGMVAAWPRASRELRGLERRMVSAHLAGCRQCRAELEHLGHLSRLDPVTLVASPPSPGARRPHPFVAWSGWVAAAALAVTLAWPRERHAPLAPPPDGTLAAPRTPAAVGAPGGAALLVAPAGPRRGVEPPPVRLLLGGDERYLHVVVPALELPDSERVSATLQGPQAGGVWRLEIVNADLFGGRGLVFGDGRSSIPAGAYRLILDGRGIAGEERAAYRFELSAGR